MKIPYKSIMWFVALACVAIGIGLESGLSKGFLTFGGTSLASLFVRGFVGLLSNEDLLA